MKENPVVDMMYKISMQVQETTENFIFDTIKPYCEEHEQRIISKQDLIDAFNSKNKLDKMRRVNSKATKEYLESLISAWRCATERNKLNPKYRYIWASEKDIEALNVAIQLIDILENDNG